MEDGEMEDGEMDKGLPSLKRDPRLLHTFSLSLSLNITSSGIICLLELGLLQGI